MRKITFILIILLFIPVVNAWTWPTHQNLVESVYYSLPLSLDLDLEALKNGSIAPDRDFHDNVLHHYPPSYNKTLFWLNKTVYFYDNKDYEQASYSFGVASHYISDSFLSPHYIGKEPYELHAEFENQVKDYKIKSECETYNLDLNNTLYEASKEGTYWENWIETKNSEIPKKEVENSIRLLYSIALTTFNTQCISYPKTKITSNSLLNTKNLIFLAILSILIFVLLLSMRKN